MNPLALKLIICLVMLVGSFGAGWRTRGAFEAEASAKNAEAVATIQAGVAATLEAKLADLRANERVIERETQKIIEKPVYRTVCIDDGGLRLLESARTGTRPSEPAGKVP